MVKYTGHAVDKVVMLKRPIKKVFRIWSYSFSCCSYMCTFQVYQGSQVVVVTGKKTPAEGLANWDLMAGLNHVLYCEKFYSSGPLADALIKQQIFIVSTIKKYATGFSENIRDVPKPPAGGYVSQKIVTLSFKGLLYNLCISWAHGW